MLKVNEIFRSIQGESSYAGLPCTFIRLTGCNLRCTYCDTVYAFYEGKEMTIEDILAELDRVNAKKSHHIEITGGEPLLQEEVLPLSKTLLDLGHRVLVETNGSIDIDRVDRRSVVIMDIKTPGSSMADKNDFDNIHRLTSKDEVKFIISDRTDYDWSKNILMLHEMPCTVLFSPVNDKISSETLSEWIIVDDLPVRLNMQLHKYIWGENALHR
jgi:7-carboxy-7-deazaguanine synthase